MANKDELNLDVESPAPAKGVKLKFIIILLVGLVLVAAIAGGAVYFFMGGEAEEAVDAGPAPVPPPIYKSLEPALVVNFQGPGRIRYVQVGVVMTARDAKVMDTVDEHMPVIRNNLIMLLSGKTYEELNTREGKEEVRVEVLDTIRGVLQERTGEPGIESVYFTSFVMQ
ncbi:MAG TPA: flagellar basal body-associated FliL family protein [Thioalkalivibrio sp.]|nr:flagellar basal body-associated FliL family protein [Thioalkalivibrio sp.]